MGLCLCACFIICECIKANNIKKECLRKKLLLYLKSIYTIVINLLK